MSVKSICISMLPSLFTLLLITMLVPPASATCMPLVHGESWQDSGGQTNPARFCFDIAEPSLVVLQLRQPVIGSRAHLAWGAEGSGAATLLHHSAAVLAAMVEPGVYQVEVRSDDPTETLMPFQLRFDRLRIPIKGEEDPELEPDPNPLVSPCVGCLDLGEEDPELEPDPNPLRLAEFSVSSDLSKIPGLGRAQLATLCGGLSDAERGDSFLCATAVKHAHSFEEGGGGARVVRFTVGRLGPVEIRAEGDGIAELYDRHGQRLAVLRGEAVGFQEVRTLVPGVYFLRVEGGGEPVRLSVSSPSR
jgi:hypothetical protein